jgi:hypothetical protein
MLMRTDCPDVSLKALESLRGNIAPATWLLAKAIMLGDVRADCSDKGKGTSGKSSWLPWLKMGLWILS